MITRSGARITVDGPITIGNFRATLAEGLAQIRSGASEIDLSKVEGVDSSAISLLLEWMREAKRRNADLSFFDMKEDLNSLVKLYGMSGLFARGEAGSPK